MPAEAKLDVSSLAESGDCFSSVTDFAGARNRQGIVFDFQAGIGEGGDAEQGHMAESEGRSPGVLHLFVEPTQLFLVEEPIEGIFVAMDGIESEDTPALDVLGPISVLHAEELDRPLLTRRRRIVTFGPLFDIVIAEDTPERFVKIRFREASPVVVVG